MQGLYGPRDIIIDHNKAPTLCATKMPTKLIRQLTRTMAARYALGL